MKKLSLICLMLSLFASTAIANEYVEGYYKSNGTYVAPHYRSSPDNSYNNNYNTKGNTNPYTGEQGNSTRTYNDRSPEYNQKSYGNSGYESNPTYNYNTGSGTIYRKRY